MKTSALKIILKKAVTRVPLAFFSNILKQNLTIPYYHMISDAEVLHTKHLYPHKTAKQFAADLDFIAKYYTPIHITSLIAPNKQGQSLPGKALLLTFDDGFSQMHDIVAPVLLRKGIPAIFFINSSFTDNRNLCFQHKVSLVVEHILNNSISAATQNKIEQILSLINVTAGAISSSVLSIKYAQRDLIDQVADILEINFEHYLQTQKPYLTTGQIHKLIADGFSIGAHSIDHPLYRDISLDEQLRQTLESIRFVRTAFNLDYGAFAFPHSDSGVSKSYFDKIEKSGLVDISFGTAGMIEDCVPNHFQRFSLEKPLMPAKKIFAYQFARRLWRDIKNNTIINRS